MSSYHEELKKKETIQLRALLEELPDFLEEFFRGIAQTTSTKTRVAYAYDLKVFFQFLTLKHKKLKGIVIEEFSVNHLLEIESEDIDRFLEYVTFYTREPLSQQEKALHLQNDAKGKSRKLAAIRSMFRYFYKKKKLPSNPAALVDIPKIHEKQIVRLDVDELANLLDTVETGEHLTDHQKRYHAHTSCRDLAMISLLLGTGMRVSECVGINLSDLDFQNNGVMVTRKGGNQVTLYFGEEVQEALFAYLAQREKITPPPPHQDALFLSSRNTRISVRAVQNLVKKYASLVVPGKKISPHKLRSTYGTNLYQETGDIYLVADVLGHADVNTTKKHYAQIEDSRRRSAAKYIKLRKND